MIIKIGTHIITSNLIFKVLACIDILTIVGQIYLRNTGKVCISNETLILSIVIFIGCIYFGFK